MTRHRSSACRSEQGAALVLVLVFITALSLVIGSLLFASSTAQKNTVVTASLTNAYYAADAGVEYAISQLRSSNGLCPAGGFYEPLPTTIAPGQSLTVTCGGGGSDEAEQGASSWAVVTFNPGVDSLTSRSGNGVEKQVSGRVFVNGHIDLQSKLRSNSAPPDLASATYPLGDGVGYVYQANDRCLTQPAGGINLLITPNYSCTALTVNDVDPKPPLPTLPVLTRPRGPQVTIGSCGVFFPGVYDDASPNGTPANPNPLGLLSGAGQSNYFVSGVYYFKNLDEINFSNYRVFAGEDANEPRTLSTAPCATDAAASTAAATAGVDTGMNVGDRGAQIILGGTSWLDIDQSDAEFLAYRPSGDTKGRGVSIRSVPSGDPLGYVTSNPVSGTNPDNFALTVASGANPHFSVHGLLYSPAQSIEINDTNTSAAQILGGVMAWNLAINASASASALVVQVTGERPKSRSKVVVEGRAPVSATKIVKSRAVVDVYVEPPSRTVTDGVLNGTPTVTSATANFTADDVGSAIFRAPIPDRTYIKIVNNGTTVTLSQAAPSSPTPVQMTIDPSSRSVADAIITDGSTTVRSATMDFTEDDIGGSIVSAALLDGDLDDRIPAGTSIVAVNPLTDSATLSQAADFTPNGSTETGVRVTLTKRRVTVNILSWRVENP